MADDQLDTLSSAELHDLAVDHAKHHLDARFFWRLMKTLPAAEAAAGQVEEAGLDMHCAVPRLCRVTDAGKGEAAATLRPFYPAYLREAGVQPPRRRRSP